MTTEIEKKLFAAANKCDAETVIEIMTTEASRTFRRISMDNSRTAARVIVQHDHFLTLDDPTKLILAACCGITSYTLVESLLKNDTKKIHPEISTEVKLRALELANLNGGWYTVITLYKNLGNESLIKPWVDKRFRSFIKDYSDITNLKNFWDFCNKEVHSLLTQEYVEKLHDLIKERIEVIGDPDGNWVDFYNQTISSFPGKSLEPSFPPPPYHAKQFCLIL